MDIKPKKRWPTSLDSHLSKHLFISFFICGSLMLGVICEYAVCPSDCSLEEVVVLCIKNAVCKPLEEEKEGQQDTDINTSTKEKDSSTSDTSYKNRRNKKSTEVASTPGQTDPLLWAAFSETPPQHSPSEEISLTMDHIARCVELMLGYRKEAKTGSQSGG